MVIGHHAIVEHFERLTARGALAHAYLFYGPLSVGKRTVAQTVAKMLLCAKFRDADHDERACAVCARIERGMHPNAVLCASSQESGKQAISIGAIRALRTSLRFTEIKGEPRAVILENAEHITREAANAFLKTLEEPNENIYFFLIARHATRLPATIVSRVQAIRFNFVSNADIEAGLCEAGESAPHARDLATLAAGRPGFALRAKRDPSFDRLLHEIETLIPRLAGSSVSDRIRAARSLSALRHEEPMILGIAEAYVGEYARRAMRNGQQYARGPLETARRFLELVRVLETTNVNEELAFIHFAFVS